MKACEKTNRCVQSLEEGNFGFLLQSKTGYLQHPTHKKLVSLSREIHDVHLVKYLPRHGVFLSIKTCVLHSSCCTCVVSMLVDCLCASETLWTTDMSLRQCSLARVCSHSRGYLAWTHATRPFCSEFEMTPNEWFVFFPEKRGSCCQPTFEIFYMSWKTQSTFWPV